MRAIILANLIVLLVVALAALFYSSWFLIRSRKNRGLRSLSRRELRVWARVQQVEPHRFETRRHLRARIVESMQPRRETRAAGISDLDSKRAARA